MICTECHTDCEMIGTEPYVIYICANCGQVVDPEKAPKAEREQMIDGEQW